MSEREEDVFVWGVVAALVGVLVGWWLAVQAMAQRVGQVAAMAVAATPVGVQPVRPGLAPLSLKERSEDFLTVKELEKHLPLCGKSIRREIGDGKLPSHRMRGKLTVKGSDALAWLSARKES
jgi:hypothetical protein